jgi:hypothetical protein
VKPVVINKFRIYKIVHSIFWIVWAILTLLTFNKSMECYNQTFGAYLSFNIFKWFEIGFMFGGGILLLIFSVRVLKIGYWAFALFELLLLLIIFVRLVLAFYCN